MLAHFNKSSLKMELDEDNHLCLRCGKTILGLDNYVLHRREQCLRFNNSDTSPLLSDSPTKVLPESEAQDLNPTYSQDIYRLSANDFFLSLNLQSIACENQKCLNNTNESFSSRLDLPSLENELTSSTFEDKSGMCTNIIEDENSIGEIGSNAEKWDYNFKFDNLDNIEQNFTKNKVETNFVADKTLMLPVEPAYVNNLNEDKQIYLSTESNTVHINKRRKSFHQELEVFSRQKHCLTCNSFLYSENTASYECKLCKFKYTFCTNFLNHLLNCKFKQTDIIDWETVIFENNSLFVRNLPFICDICLFYCSDSISFLTHLKSSSHCLNSARLKNCLICLPCQKECSASDEIIEHFSKVHSQAEKNEHPVTVLETKKNLHCCFCSIFANRIKNVQLDDVGKLMKDDIAYIKRIFPVFILCAVGVSKNLLSYAIKIINIFFDKSKKNSNQDMCKTITLNCIDGDHDICELTDSNGSSTLKQATKQKDFSSAKLTKAKSFFQPQVCKKKYINSYKKNLKTSLNKKNLSPKESKYTCIKCNSYFLSRYSLKQHLKCHKSEENYNFSEIINNEKKENQSNTYLCDKCGYAGKTVHQLTKHKRSHTGEKPFKCSECAYSCCLSSQLLRHKRLHTGSKPYKCPYCSYTCNTQENLRKHVLKTKKHKGKKLYPCQHCDFDCNTFLDFKDHLLNFHSEHFPNKDDIISSAVAGIYVS